MDNNLFFNEEVRFGEDQVFHFSIYPRAKKTVLISDKLYDYRVAREGSLMATVASDLQRKGIEHVPISRAILQDWKTAGFLSKYSADMLNWVVDFNVYEALSLPVGRPPSRFELLSRKAAYRINQDGLKSFVSYLIHR